MMVKVRIERNQVEEDNFYQEEAIEDHRFKATDQDEEWIDEDVSVIGSPTPRVKLLRVMQTT